jgi:hypothetical protein
MTEEAGSEMAALRAELLTLRRVVDQQTSDQRALNTALVTGDKRLDEMRQRFVETMAERDLRLKERHDLEGMAIKAALAANDRRLDAMNEFRGSLNDALIRMTTRKESEDALDALAAKSEAQMNTLGERIDGRMAPVDARLEQGRRHGAGASPVRHLCEHVDGCGCGELDHPVHEHRVERRPGLHVQRHELDARGLTASSTGTVHG